MKKTIWTTDHRTLEHYREMSSMPFSVDLMRAYWQPLAGPPSAVSQGLTPCPARVSPYNTPHGAAGMPPSLICTRICPPPATEGPPPGGGPSVRFKRRLNNHRTFLGTILRVTILVFPSTMEIL